MRENGPFDGYFGFSHGADFQRILFTEINYLNKDLYKDFHHPLFNISFAGGIIPNYLFKYKNKVLS